MYKKIFLILLPLLVPLMILCQNNSISLIVGNSNFTEISAKKLDGLLNITEKKKSIGIGLEYKKQWITNSYIGWRLNFESINVNVQRAETYNSNFVKSKSIVSEQEYSTRFSVGKIYNFKRYNLGASLNIPFAYTITSYAFSTDTTLSLTTGIKDVRNQRNYYPNSFSTGILFLPNLGYDITNKFSINLEFNTGYILNFNNGNRRIVDDYFQNFNLTNHTDENWRYDINTLRFVFFPNIRFQYNW